MKKNLYSILITISISVGVILVSAAFGNDVFTEQDAISILKARFPKFGSKEAAPAEYHFEKFGKNTYFLYVMLLGKFPPLYQRSIISSDGSVHGDSLESLVMAYIREYSDPLSEEGRIALINNFIKHRGLNAGPRIIASVDDIADYCSRPLIKDNEGKIGPPQRQIEENGDIVYNYWVWTAAAGSVIEYNFTFNKNNYLTSIHESVLENYIGGFTPHK